LNEKIDRKIRYRLLKLLSENPKMTQRDLSAEMGIICGGFLAIKNSVRDPGGNTE
jgi:putative heme degradation protein